MTKKKKQKKKKQFSVYPARLNSILAYLGSYQHALKALIASISNTNAKPPKPEIATIGEVEVWPCTDGAVILIYKSAVSEISIKKRYPVKKSVNEFLQEDEASSLYDSYGNTSRFRPSIHIGDVRKSIFHMAGLSVESGRKKFRTKYQRAMIFGWNVQLPEPSEEALKDFRAAYASRNVGGAETEEVIQQERVDVFKKKAKELISEFESLLKESTAEESLQVFLKEHPEFLYPDFIECFPKFKLGKEFVTDYVLQVQGHSGKEHVFVEIERADKPIFTAMEKRFSYEFTQAKGQLLDWENWISKNRSYIANDFPDLHSPKFHLVMGRSTNFSREQTEKLKTEFARTNREFSTYDDLVKRFKQIITHLTD